MRAPHDVPASMLRAVEFDTDDAEEGLTVVALVPIDDNEDEMAW